MQRKFKCKDSERCNANFVANVDGDDERTVVVVVRSACDIPELAPEPRALTLGFG